jgi:hypothetical protein
MGITYAIEVSKQNLKSYPDFHYYFYTYVYYFLQTSVSVTFVDTRYFISSILVYSRVGNFT